MKTILAVFSLVMLALSLSGCSETHAVSQYLVTSYRADTVSCAGGRRVIYNQDGTTTPVFNSAGVPVTCQ